MYEPLIPAQAEPDASRVPFSPRYGDVYHSASGGLAQAHYVFLRGNGLPERWQGRPAFTVCETGFGMGLNFLVLWRAWLNDPQRCQRLHMVSIEAHPFRRNQLQHWLQQVLPSSFEAQRRELIRQWPVLTPGLHRLEFEGGAVTLTLAFGRAEVLAPQLDFQADAFFLDGFAPRLNPDMWSHDLLSQLARRAAAGATAATWAATGAVRRALAAVGFAVEKRPGFGGKREMTVAGFLGAPSHHGHTVSVARPGSVLVIGAGLAGSGVAWAMARRGWHTTVVAPAGRGFRTPFAEGQAGASGQYAAVNHAAAGRVSADSASAGHISADGASADSASVCGISTRLPSAGGTSAGRTSADRTSVGHTSAGASSVGRTHSAVDFGLAHTSWPGHVAAALTPLADRDDSVRARLSRSGALRVAAALVNADHNAATADLSAAAQTVGTVQVMRRNRVSTPEAEHAWRESFTRMQFPNDWLRPVDAAEASALAGQPVSRGGLYFASGTLVQPPKWCAALLAHAGIRHVQASASRLYRQGSFWHVQCTDGQRLGGFEHVVVAAGPGTVPLLQSGALASSLNVAHTLRLVGGQVTMVPTQVLLTGAPACIVAGEGYVLPAVDGWCVVGSSYDHTSPAGLPIPVSSSIHEDNVLRARALLPALPSKIDVAACAGWTGWRAVLPGRLPVIGPVPGEPGLWLATGYASRGLTWSLLGGDVIAAALNGEPALLECDLGAAISPQRLINAV